MDQTLGVGRPENKNVVQGIMDTAMQVVSKPVEFFKSMPRTGGFGDPLVFAVALGVVSGVLRGVLGLVHLGGAFGIGAAMRAIIVTPIAVLIGGFIGAAIMFVIWKLMGSNESYETAYRCGAYISAISPIAVLAGIVPYVGALVGIAWGLYLVVTASVEVHKIAARTAWLVFGILAGIFVLASVSSQLAARKMQRAMSGWSSQMGSQMNKAGKEMTPEEAGRAAAAFMKGMQEEAAKNAKNAKPDQAAP